MASSIQALEVRERVSAIATAAEFMQEEIKTSDCWELARGSDRGEHKLTATLQSVEADGYTAFAKSFIGLNPAKFRERKTETHLSLHASNFLRSESGFDRLDRVSTRLQARHQAVAESSSD